MEKDELNKKILDFKFRDTQFVHEIRKKETENEKMKDRLNQFIQDRTRSVKNGIEILNSLQKENNKRTSLRKNETVFETIFPSKKNYSMETKLCSFVCRNCSMTKCIE
jgi:hypothetical protein